MDLATYDQYVQMGRSLSETDRKMLRQMVQDPFFAEQKALFEKMLETGIKLEQECIL
ncbi:MAG: hypothetical protein Q4C63_03515 [Eubacteriales bacterium]|nr:hypothetical protein [Eubacteriales bacterium]